MVDKYDEFTNKKKAIDNQKKELKKKVAGLNRQKLQVRLDQFNKQRQDIAKKMNRYVAGSSNFS